MSRDLGTHARFDAHTIGRRVVTSFALVVFALSGCSASHVTQLVVVVDSDLAVPSALDGIRVAIEGPSGMTQTIERSLVGPGRLELPMSFSLVPAGDALGPVEVVATGTRDGTDVITRSAIVTLVQDESRVLVLFLGANCVGVECTGGYTCVEGQCVDPRINELPPFTGELPVDDAGVVDAPASDGGVGDACPPEGCECVEGTPCRTEAGCEVGETRCDAEGNATCEVTGLVEAGSVCRAATSECDVEEVCDGESPVCPTDAFVATGEACDDGFCDGLGACSSGCTPGAACSTGNVCERGEIECSGGAPRCVAVGAASAGTVCRAAVGPCDAEEACDGTSTACPDDRFRSASTVCRAADGVCDLDETCTGSSALCPGDGFVETGEACPGGFCDGLGECSSGCTPGAQCSTGNPCELGRIDCGMGTPRCVGAGPAPAGTTCRDANGVCDVAETCSGSSTTCPADGFAPSTRVCRDSVGECDVPDFCSGSSAACPADARRPSTFECRASAGVCDLAENCDGTSTGCPADVRRPSSFVCRGSMGACDVADTCNGGVACPADAKRSNGFVCRAAGAGGCDVAETCNGTGNDCPSDGFASGGTVCRPAVAGGCDVAETCSGTSATCPADVAAPGGTVCRAARGDCDVAETCNGMSTSCPTDQRRPMGFVCRAAPIGATCDAAETCSGVADSCPADAFRSAGEICRASRDFECDVAESCTGSSPFCPPNETAGDGGFCGCNGRCENGDCRETGLPCA